METQADRLKKIVEDTKNEWVKKRQPKVTYKKVKHITPQKPPRIKITIPPKLLEILNEEKSRTVEYVRNKYRECQNEDCKSKDNLTIDHIVPVSYLKQLGFISIETLTMRQRKNLTILCGRCNNKKGDKIDLKNKKVKRLMVWYLKNYEKIKWTELE